MLTLKDIVRHNIDGESWALRNHRDQYIMEAALAKDAGYENVCTVYLDVVAHLEICIQALETIPPMVRTE